MKKVETLSALKRELRALRKPDSKVGFVPTMGALHDGHLDLVKTARKECDGVVVSIFVNPIQFGPQEDLKTYPRDLPGDAQKCKKAGVDLLFVPAPDALYPDGFRTYVTVEELSGRLCGKSRPGHFLGVATVVLKLLNLVTPDRLYLGQKDYQQCVIIRRMVRDLDLAVEAVICPTVREPDGLAMSSRNIYLNPEERRAAAVLYRALREAAEAYRSGELRAKHLTDVLRRILASEPRAAVEYIQVIHPETLQEVETAREGTVLALAVRIGKTRLIDNWILGKSPHPPFAKRGEGRI